MYGIGDREVERQVDERAKREREAMREAWERWERGVTAGKPPVGGGETARPSGGDPPTGGVPGLVSPGIKWQEPTEAQRRYGAGGFKLRCPRPPRGYDPGEWEAEWGRAMEEQLRDRAELAESGGCRSVHGHDEISTDWLTVRFVRSWLEDVSAILEFYYGCPLPDEARGINGYAHCRRWGNGLKVAFDDVGSRVHGDKFSAMIPGECLRSLPASQVCDLIVTLGKMADGASRVDIAFDDFRRRIAPHDLVESGAARKVVGFDDFVWCRPEKRVKGSEWGYSGDGVRFGTRRRDSIGHVEVYDKAKESDGARDSIRWESRFQGDKASVIWAGLVKAAADGVSALVKFCGEAVGGFLDFREEGSGSDRHLERRPRLEFWQSIIDEIGEAYYAVDRVKPSLEESAAWAEKAWPRTLAKMAMWAGLCGGDENSVVGFLRDLMAPVVLRAEEVDEIVRAGVPPAESVLGRVLAAGPV